MAKKKMTTEVLISNSLFNVKIGTLNKACPDTIYIEMGVFLTPTIEEDTYNEETDYLEHSFRQMLRELVVTTNYFNKDYICVFEVPSNRMKIGKKSFLSIQCHFKPKTIKKVSEMGEDMESFMTSLSNSFAELLEKEKFVYSKTKRA